MFFMNSRRFEAIVTPLTGVVISPFIILCPLAPIEKSPLTGSIVCSPMNSVTYIPQPTRESSDCGLSVPGSKMRFVVPTSGREDMPREQLPVDLTPSFAAYWRL